MTHAERETTNTPISKEESVEKIEDKKLKVEKVEVEKLESLGDSVDYNDLDDGYGNGNGNDDGVNVDDDGNAIDADSEGCAFDEYAQDCADNPNAEAEPVMPKFTEQQEARFSQELLNLNEKQRIAVDTFDVPLLVLSGAGSGKTKVVTNKIGAILSRSMSFPWQILAVTFTNKAAKEMMDRVKQCLMCDTKDINIGTFHSICAKMLRANCADIGFTKDFSILDSQDQRKLMKNIMQEHNISVKIHPPAKVISKISKIKNEGITPEEFVFSPLESVEFSDGVNIGTLYSSYQERLKVMNSMDFDDLILKMVRLLIAKPDLQEYYQKKFKYIFIDEYQDINSLQFKWFKFMVGENKNVCCVGDDDQSIYGWRGSDIKIILSFAKHFPGAQIVRLEQNYRSTKNILKAAHNLIKNNVNRIDKEIWTDKASGDLVTITQYTDSKTEAQSIGKSIRSMKGVDLVDYNDIAVLVRASSQTRSLEEAMMSLGLPYKIVGGLRFYERREVKDVISYVKVIFDNYDDIAFERMLQTPRRGIGESSIDKLYQYAKSKGLSLISSLMMIFYEDCTEIERLSIIGSDDKRNAMKDESPTGETDEPNTEDGTEHGGHSGTGMLFDIGSSLDSADKLKKKTTSKVKTTALSKRASSNFDSCEKLFSSRAMKLFAKVASDIVRWRDEYQKCGDIGVVIADIMEEVKYPEFLEEDDSTTSQARLENVNEIINLMQGFNDIVSFLEHISLYGDLDTSQEEVSEVKIMTIHTAKGLEYKYVFCPGWEEGLFPSGRTVEESGEAGIEEERRLAYVAITRAMKKLFLSHAKMRFSLGGMFPTKESPFIQEIRATCSDCITYRDKTTLGGSVGKNFGGSYGSNYNKYRNNSRSNTEVSGKKTALKLKQDKEFQDVKKFLDTVTEDTKMESIKPSNRVRHKTYGEGTVIRQVSAKLIEVKFDNKDETKTIRYDFLVLVE